MYGGKKRPDHRAEGEGEYVVSYTGTHANSCPRRQLCNVDRFEFPRADLLRLAHLRRMIAHNTANRSLGANSNRFEDDSQVKEGLRR